jgi:hypothetical protein
MAPIFTLSPAPRILDAARAVAGMAVMSPVPAAAATLVWIKVLLFMGVDVWVNVALNVTKYPSILNEISQVLFALSQFTGIPYLSIP